MAGWIHPATEHTGRSPETTPYKRLQGIERPWRLRDARLALERDEVRRLTRRFIEAPTGTRLIVVINQGWGNFR